VLTNEEIFARYSNRRVVLVTDRSLLSLDNLQVIRQLQVGGELLENILAVPVA